VIEHPAQFVPIRRIVTGHDAQGNAIIREDGEATNHKGANPERRSTLLWATRETPADFLSEEDAGRWDLDTSPPPGGTRFCIIETMPGATHAAPHRTDTIDYVICLEGEMTMDLDDSTIVMRSGDVLIQMGTNHLWRNESQEIARVAFVLVDGVPKNSSSLPLARR
jgi:mannose-6-phosphate isomerase-like protein (cupin superfamily)